MKNFAYGSNMCQWWLQRRVAGARYEFVARLPEHALRFHKVSKLDGSGKGDVVHTGDPTDGVWGVVVHVPDDERRLLDTAEGPGYEVRSSPSTIARAAAIRSRPTSPKSQPSIRPSSPPTHTWD